VLSIKLKNWGRPAARDQERTFRGAGAMEYALSADAVLERFPVIGECAGPDGGPRCEPGFASTWDLVSELRKSLATRKLVRRVADRLTIEC